MVLASCLVAVAAWAAVLPPRRAILVSFDGLGGLDLARRIAAGELSPDGFARAAREGFSAERLVVVTPSLTAVSHASISTGALPQATGIVSNSFHPAGAPPGTLTDAFEAESRVETLWEAAARQGKRVASLAWPGISQKGPRTRTPVGLEFHETKHASILWTGPKEPPTDARVALPLGVDSFAPPKSIRVEKEDPGRPLALSFVALDTTDDGRRAYDQILVFDARGALLAKARAGEWFEATERREEDGGDRDVLFSRWGKLLALAPDLSRITLYLGQVTRNRARPDDFRRTLDRDAGVWPASPDALFLTGGHHDAASFVEQAARFSRFFVRAFEVARRRGDWTLLMAYQPLVDEAEHVFLLVDPRQPGYTKARAAEDAAALRQAMAAADRAAAAYLRFAEEGDVFFVSDHGQRPAWRSFALREALRRKGWIKTAAGEKGGAVVAADSPADAAVESGIAFVYVNRAAPGMSEESARRLARDIAADLSSRRDPAGAPLFSQVLPVHEAGARGLDTPNSGDVIAILANGTVASGAFLPRPDEPLFGTPDSPGKHGYGPDPALDGVFFHVGEGVARERVPAFRAIDVAGRIALRLGLEPFGAPR